MKNIFDQKQALRIDFTARRNNLPESLRFQTDSAVCRSLLSCDILHQADILLAYAPKGSEINIMPVVDFFLKHGKQVAFPRCEDLNGMTFRFSSPAELSIGKFGILTPAEDAPICSDFSRSLCLVPALLFDRRGHRLGYGKGYYDRFLKNFSGISVGIARHDFIVPTLPTDQYDHPVNIIVSESEVIAVS